MSRRTSSDVDLDPAVAAELEALEAALADAPGADPQLTALVREVREQAPSMPLALRERLDADVAAGFPRRRAKRSRGLRPVLGAGAVVAATAAAVVVVIGLNANQSSDIHTFSKQVAVSGDTAAGGAASESAAPRTADPLMETRSAATPSAVPGASGSAVVPAQPGRKVERDVQMTLRVGLNELETASDGVVRTTQSVGGFVQTSSVSARGRSGDATFVLRVPTARLDTAIAKLSKLGHVTALDQHAQDITAQFTSAATLLGDARRERAALLRALGKASTDGEIAALRLRIAHNRASIARLQARVASLRRRADLSTVSVAVESRREAAGGSAGGGGWTPGDALHDAGRVLQVAAGVAIVVLAALVPVALLGLLALLGWRVVRRRRREHALDSA